MCVCGRGGESIADVSGSVCVCVCGRGGGYRGRGISVVIVHSRVPEHKTA